MIQQKRDNDVKVLLIGWDAADWKIIHRLIDEGKMPNMAGFVEEGVIGNLATIRPDLSPMLWTSIATGKRPFKHRVLGFIEPDPHGGGVRPITNMSRKTKAVWNILTQAGKRCHVIGWWPSHPVEPINGVMVSNHYQRATAPYGKPWPIAPGTVHPDRLIRNLAELRVHPQELDAGLIINFVPMLADIDQDGDHRIETLAKIIADCTTVNKAATAVMIHEPWDFTAVYYDGIDHFSHGFMHYHPPRLPWVNETDFELYKGVVESGYIYHDILLGTLLDKAGSDAFVMIVSDHGFHSDHLRPRHIPKEPAGPAVQHRPYGIFAVKGPGIKKDEIIYGASLVPSWDSIPGEDGRHPADMRIDPAEAKAAMDQLIELGYIERPDEDRENAAQQSMRELDYNLARAYMDAGLHMEAVPILEDLVSGWPDEYRFGLQLVSCFQTLGRIREARPMLERVFERKTENVNKASKSLEALKRKHGGTPSKDLTEEHQAELRRLSAEVSRNPYALEFLMGSLLFEEGDPERALAHFEAAEKEGGRNPAIHTRLGNVYLKMKKPLDAKRSFEKALSIDSEYAEANLGLSRAYLNLRKNVDAAEAAMTAVGLCFHNPRGHFLLGVAFHRIGRLADAVSALRLAVTQNPNYPEAHRRLSYIYANRLNEEALAETHRQLAKEAATRIAALKRGILPSQSAESAGRTSITSDQTRTASPQDAVWQGPVDLENTVVVVSGLPRSGTSMMMQMLSGGGLPTLTEGKRTADEDNPRGYFEYEKVRQLRRDASWLPEASGKAIKIVAQLL
ncbi:MAG: alkaline phosphatase family protein, partial [Deltaproteobacteria bacterium]|nr:alkaline phosphatase family protein [Deltaproteobacteria bacterium]